MHAAPVEYAIGIVAIWSSRLKCEIALMCGARRSIGTNSLNLMPLVLRVSKIVPVEVVVLSIVRAAESPTML